MYLERMYLLLQRLKRNRKFSRPAFAGIQADSRQHVEVSACSEGIHPEISNLPPDCRTAGAYHALRLW